MFNVDRIGDKKTGQTDRTCPTVRFIIFMGQMGGMMGNGHPTPGALAGLREVVPHWRLEGAYRSYR